MKLTCHFCVAIMVQSELGKHLYFLFTGTTRTNMHIAQNFIYIASRITFPIVLITCRWLAINLEIWCVRGIFMQQVYFGRRNRITQSTRRNFCWKIVTFFYFITNLSYKSIKYTPFHLLIRLCIYLIAVLSRSVIKQELLFLELFICQCGNALFQNTFWRFGVTSS